MRQQHDVLECQIARIHARLAVIDIESGGRHVPRFERGDQRPIIDQAAARGVGDDRAPGQHRQPRFAQPLPRSRATRRVQRKNLARAKEPLLVGVENRARLALGRQARDVVVVHFHREPARNPRKLPPDPAHPENPEPSPRNFRPDELRRSPAHPLPCAHQPLALARPPRRGEDQQHGKLGGRDRKHVRRVAHADPAQLRRIEIDMLEPDAERAERPHALRQRRDRRRVHLIGRAAQHGIGARRRREQLRPIERTVPLAQPCHELARGALLHRLRQAPRHQQDRPLHFGLLNHRRVRDEAAMMAAGRGRRKGRRLAPPRR